jgi:hypothetical protein
MTERLRVAAAFLFTTLIVIPLRTALFLDETEPLRRRWRRRK